ncbi:HsdM family class I SAM-dependent methyltransferase [Algoriphagus chordae]|nr:class I SAM-dependent DNA methyltransferase [Algoriphagus chordae]
MEETLWDSANKLRGTVESSEYKHVVLGLIFLKFASDTFAQRREELIAEGKEKYLEMAAFYNMKNVFFLAPESRWNHVIDNAKQDNIALIVDTALHTIEKNNPSLKGALPDNYFSRLNLDPSKLAALLDTINNIDTVGDAEEDVVGRIYEYFLGRFAAAEGKGGGEFYTPKCIVNLIAEMLEPYKGKIYDPACGSGGMFVQSIDFVKSHQGNTKDISIYGQEYTAVTYKLAKMNLAIRGISANLGDVPADTFFKDQHPDLKADYIMANPPFNQSQWREKNELEADSRWSGFTTPPAGNANYAWILHMLSKLSENGTAGFVLANGSMSSNTSGEGEIRQQLVDKDMVDCMIALPGQLFYTTQIPVCLWFITKNKASTSSATGNIFRDRRGETLFIDARQLGSMIDRTQKELTKEDISYIANTYHTWRNSSDVRLSEVEAPLDSAQPDNVIAPARSGGSDEGAKQSQSLDGTDCRAALAMTEAYEDIPGYCKSATLAEIQANDYVLTPGRYVGVAEEEDDGIHFEDKMTELTAKLKDQMAQAEELDQAIRENLKVLGYNI